MGLYENQSWSDLPGRMMRPGGIALTDRLLHLAALAPHSRILDLGCGFGTTTAHLSSLGHHTSGIDASPENIRRGHDLYPEADLQVSSSESLPWRSRIFDALISECSLSLMDLPSVLASCLSVLKPNGKLLISDLYALEPMSPKRLEAVEVRHFLTHDEWAEKLEAAGFSLLIWEDQTNAWKNFAAQVLWDHGSLLPFLHCSEENIQSLGRPGYFLAVARIE
jgi:SAM-dependent methyltransferase